MALAGNGRADECFFKKRRIEVPKIKSSRGAVKRFKITATGKVKRSKAFKGHLLSSKGKKRKRRLRQGALVASVETKNVRKLIPYL